MWYGLFVCKSCLVMTGHWEELLHFSLEEGVGEQETLVNTKQNFLWTNRFPKSQFYTLIWHVNVFARWLVSSFFTTALVKDKVLCHCWYDTLAFLFRQMERYLSRKISLYFPKRFSPAFNHIKTLFLEVLFSTANCPRDLQLLSHFLYFCPIYSNVVYFINIFH